MKLRTVLVCSLLVAAPALAAAPDPAKGQVVFKQCSICHSIDGAAKVGPTMKGLFNRAKLTNGQKPTEAAVAAKIDQGGAGMPKYKTILNAEQKADLIAYLKTL